VSKTKKPAKTKRPAKTVRSQRSRAEILDAAWDLIAARGADVSLAEIADAVGMTRQSIYVHFGSRGGLLVALARRADEREDIFAKFDAALAIADPAERLDRYVKAWLVFVPKIHPVASDLIRLRVTDPDAERAWSDRMADLLDCFRALATSLARDGALADGWTAARAADYLWAACSVQAWALLVCERGWRPAAASKTIRASLARVLLA